MKKFNFRLQKLLEIREKDEEKSIVEFKSAESKKKSFEEKLNILSNEYVKYNNINGAKSTIERKIIQNYLSALNNDIEKTTKLLHKQTKIVEEKRKELAQKQIDRKIVDTLKNKKFVLYIKEQNLIEQKINDELGLYTYYRNNYDQKL